MTAPHSQPGGWAFRGRHGSLKQDSTAPVACGCYVAPSVETCPGCPPLAPARYVHMHPPIGDFKACEDGNCPYTAVQLASPITLKGEAASWATAYCYGATKPRYGLVSSEPQETCLWLRVHGWREAGRNGRVGAAWFKWRKPLSLISTMYSTRASSLANAVELGSQGHESNGRNAPGGAQSSRSQLRGAGWTGSWMLDAKPPHLPTSPSTRPSPSSHPTPRLSICCCSSSGPNVPTCDLRSQSSLRLRQLAKTTSGRAVERWAPDTALRSNGMACILCPVCASCGLVLPDHTRKPFRLIPPLDGPVHTRPLWLWYQYAGSKARHARMRPPCRCHAGFLSSANQHAPVAILDGRRLALMSRCSRSSLSSLSTLAAHLWFRVESSWLIDIRYYQWWV